MRGNRDIDAKFNHRDHLLNVMSRVGGKSKKEKYLYHYTSMAAASNILSEGKLWLGSIDTMNDYFEKEAIESFVGKNRVFYACFSHAEENMAMYKMYTNDKDGVMMKYSYETAQNIITQLKDAKSTDLSKAEKGKMSVEIIRDGKLTGETVGATVYWAAGIAAAKERGVIFGRKGKDITPEFIEAYSRWQDKLISGAQAAAECDMGRSTFYRLVAKL